MSLLYIENLIPVSTREDMLKNSKAVWRFALPDGNIYCLVSYSKQIAISCAGVEKSPMNRIQNQEKDLDYRQDQHYR